METFRHPSRDNGNNRYHSSQWWTDGWACLLLCQESRVFWTMLTPTTSYGMSEQLLSHQSPSSLGGRQEVGEISQVFCLRRFDWSFWFWCSAVYRTSCRPDNYDLRGWLGVKQQLSIYLPYVPTVIVDCYLYVCFVECSSCYWHLTIPSGETCSHFPTCFIVHSNEEQIIVIPQSSLLVRVQIECAIKKQLYDPSTLKLSQTN